MKLIVITTEHFFEGEAAVLNALFERGMEILHLRKPGSTETELKNLIEQIDERFHKRIVLHDHYSLINIFRLKGIHLNNRNRQQPVHVSCSISRSCHSIGELENITGYEYVFLSPIFDSISKIGYKKAFSEMELMKAKQDNIINEKVIALGGITPENIAQIRSYGFGGVAVLGGIWGDLEITGVLQRFENYKNERFIIHNS